jgi:hypothetical protein
VILQRAFKVRQWFGNQLILISSTGKTGEQRMGSNPVASGDVFRKYQQERQGKSQPRRRAGRRAVIRSIEVDPLFQMIGILRSMLAGGNLEVWERVAIEHQLGCLLKSGKAGANPAFFTFSLPVPTD